MVKAQPIPPDGHAAAVSLAEGNRDENRFPDAYRLLLDRRPNLHIGFGYGMRYCLGAPPARVEVRLGFTAPMTRFPDLRLAVPPGELTWRHDFRRGLQPVACHHAERGLTTGAS
ncbi:hypothetical protein [Paractinoplanes brasiliensis]|uniref:hypothetical protein n=1 Tax=Paractinoplanes brasiliensis TaxID=52695 RepID=UPI00105FD6CA|nr:hypothetical protein [Actinoplanes brasiliensis]GID28347.1 hypothetical protein Abr02nite_33300 [Actinoplanes brasiliensis]